MSILRLTDTKGNKYTIDDSKALGNGGEGTVISLNNGYCVKTYFKASDAISQKKIDELSPLDETLFIKPKIAVYGDANGYIMEELNLSSYYPLYSIYSISFANKNSFPKDYKKVISEKLIKGVKNAHDNNIVIGDLNPFNILVNNKLDVKFIDVDSYETKSYKHNDKLLEDIRDYYFNGKVSKESDYFALSVIIFNLLTGIHPFKGIHNVYRDKLKEREINNISLLNKKEITNIKIPKFYTPITDDALSNAFYELYQNNKRFLIDMSGKTISNVKFDAIVMSNELIVKELFNGDINNVTASNKYIAIFNSSDTKIMSAEGRGIIMNYSTIDKRNSLILTDKYIYTLHNSKLFLYNKNDGWKMIKSLVFEAIHVIKQYENILIVITTNDKLYKIYLDEVFNDNVKYEVSNIYHKSLIKVNGLYQTIGNNSIIFYNTNNRISSFIIKEKLIDIIQNRNTGIYTVIDNHKVIHKLFTIDMYGNMKTKEIDDVYPYTFNEKFIILYKDDKLHFLDSETLNEVVSFETKGLDNNQIISTNGGIITFNNVKCQVLNTK